MSNLNLTTWLKVESYSLITLLCISILISIGVVPLFGLIFALSLIILNILLNFTLIYNSEKQKSFYYLKIFLDLLSAFFIVHLTGGKDSFFIWIFIFPLITDILLFEEKLKFVPAVISTVGLFIYLIIELILSKRTITFSESDTLFFLSNAIFFSFVNWLFINFKTGIGENAALKADLTKDALVKNPTKVPIDIGKNGSIVLDKQKFDKYDEVVKVAADLATIDHDINNPLTIISLTISRIQLTAKKYNDDKLVKYSNQMSEALSKINKIYR